MEEEKRPGRPRGRRFIPISVSVTPEQAEWLGRTRNASKIIRKLLDDMRVTENLTPEYAKTLALKGRLDALKAELDVLYGKNAELVSNGRMHFKGGWHDDVLHGKTRTVENQDDPTPIDKEGEILKTVLDATKREMQRIEGKIKQIESELLQGSGQFL